MMKQVPTRRLFSSLSAKGKHHTVNEKQLATSFSTTLQHYINSNAPFPGQTIHTHILKTGYWPNTNISIKVMILHLKCGCLGYARQVFDELPRRTLSAYNYLIGGYLRRGLFKESVELVRRLVGDGQRPDGFTISMILKTSSNGGSVLLPRNLEGFAHALILRLDVEADDVLYTALVDSYVKRGRVCYARRVFETMVEKNVVCSTSMISGYMHCGDLGAAEEIFVRTVEKDVVVFNAMIEGYSKSVETAVKALELYVDMQRDGFRPNMSTFASVIGACSVLAVFEIGQQVQSQLMKCNFFNDVKSGSALIDLYAKCGRIDVARQVFDHMRERNVFSWTSMVDGYGKNGKPIEALELFGEMRESGIEPNDVTFLAALSACGHTGLVAKGLEIFESMSRDYSVEPMMEHYACMVDLMGRAGSLSQAWEFVMKMPKKPNADVWAALLSSCNLHGEMDMANIAWNELVKINSSGRRGAYLSLSNTFAAAGKWDNVSELREMMKLKGLLKGIGCSRIGTESGNEVFASAYGEERI